MPSPFPGMDPFLEHPDVFSDFHDSFITYLREGPWRDPEGVVTHRRFFSRTELATGHVRFKPDSLPDAAWGAAAALYDPLEVILK